MLNANFKYLIGFGIGLAVASVVPVVATPLKEANHGVSTLLSQAQSDRSGNAFNLNKLATCLDESGYMVRSTGSDRSGGPSDPIYTDGVVNNRGINCTRLRNEGQIQTPIGCLSNGETVQVQLKNGKPITFFWNDYEYIFVISYRDGSKGWTNRDAIEFDRSSP